MGLKSEEQRATIVDAVRTSIMRYRVPSEKGGWHDRRSRELSKKTFLSREEKDQVITLR